MRIFRRSAGSLAPGERVLASAAVVGGDDVVAGSIEALYVAGHRIPWEQVQAASWDRESGVLTVTEAGAERIVHRLAVDNPVRLLQLVRERVTASLVLQRAVPLPAGSATVVARRAAGGDRGLTWSIQYDGPADPHDPAVVRLVQAALASARDDVGEV